MGGTISSMRGKSNVVHSGAKEASADRKNVRKGDGKLDRPAPPAEPEGSTSLIGRARIPRQAGEIAPGIAQKGSDHSARNIKANVVLIIQNKMRLTNQELQDVIQEVVPADAIVRDKSLLTEICTTLGHSKVGFSPDQLHALGRGLCYGLDADILRDVLYIAWMHCASPDNRRADVARWQALMGGALSTFVEREHRDADRLEQQIHLILALRPYGEYVDPRPVLGALVAERGLDKTSQDDYRKICLAASKCVPNGESAGDAFLTYIPSPGLEDIRYPMYGAFYQETLRKSQGAPFVSEVSTKKPGTPLQRSPATHQQIDAAPRAGAASGGFLVESKASGPAQLTAEEHLALKVMEDPAKRARILQALGESNRSSSS